MLCHNPVYGLRFYENDKFIFETSVCWECQNYTLNHSSRYFGFDGHSIRALQLALILHKHVPLPQNLKNDFLSLNVTADYLAGAKAWVREGAQVLIVDQKDPSKLVSPAFESGIRSGKTKSIRYFLEELKVPIAQTQINQGLNMAALFGNTEILQLLMERKGDINYEDKNHDTPLMRAARTPSLEATRFLIDKGADCSITNKRGETALMMAEDRHSSLSKNGVKTEIDQVKIHEFEEIIKILQQAEASQKNSR
jgi:hypothetical protein